MAADSRTELSVYSASVLCFSVFCVFLCFGGGCRAGWRMTEFDSKWADLFTTRTVLVVGDVMLDDFVIGRVERISPEAPVPVVVFEEEQFRVGGAANVAHNVAALGGRAEVVAVVGRDAEASRLRAELEKLEIGTRGHRAGRVTPDDEKAAGRDDAEPAGRARRLRDGP